ncbi:MAG: hypothetical protein JSS62_03910 [Verrucomicrobia bacterium]|nr:hypothetical protein [Verrucomicrobiota bacterium]MBS0647085.1 hypothetical protein [Verrucomicrobiota bacterium]
MSAQPILNKSLVDTYLPPPIKTCIPLRALVTVVALGALATFGLYCSGHLFSLPQDFVHMFSNWKAIVALSSVASALVVSSTILARIILNSKNGKFSGSEHLKPAIGWYTQKSEGSEEKQIVKWTGYTDISSQVEIKDSHNIAHPTHRVFLTKAPVENEMIAVMGSTITPAVAAGSMAFHAASIALLPLYRAAVYLYESCTQPVQRTYTLIDIPKAVISSIWGVVRSPFYMLALMMSAVYACIDPVNGRKLGSLVELQWNQGQPLHQSVWSAQYCCGGCLTYEGSVDMIQKWKEAGRPQFTIFGCWQPVAWVKKETPAEAVNIAYFTLNEKGDLHSAEERRRIDHVHSSN